MSSKKRLQFISTVPIGSKVGYEEKIWDVVRHSERRTILQRKTGGYGEQTNIAGDTPLHIYEYPAAPKSEQFIIGNEYKIGKLPVGSLCSLGEKFYDRTIISYERYKEIAGPRGKDEDRVYTSFVSDMYGLHTDSDSSTRMVKLISLPGKQATAPAKEIDGENVPVNHCTKCSNPLAKGSSDFCFEHRKEWYAKISNNPGLDAMNPDRDIVGESMTDPALLPLRSDEEIVEEEVCPEGVRTFAIPMEDLLALLKRNVIGLPDDIANYPFPTIPATLKLKSKEFQGDDINNPMIKIIKDGAVFRVEGM